MPANPGVVLIGATAMECKALRRAVPHARIVQTGIALAGLKEPLGDMVVSCGVAGGLRRGRGHGIGLHQGAVLGDVAQDPGAHRGDVRRTR